MLVAALETVDDALDTIDVAVGSVLVALLGSAMAALFGNVMAALFDSAMVGSATAAPHTPLVPPLVPPLVVLPLVVLPLHPPPLPLVVSRACCYACAAHPPQARMRGMHCPRVAFGMSACVEGRKEGWARLGQCVWVTMRYCPRMS